RLACRGVGPGSRSRFNSRQRGSRRGSMHSESDTNLHVGRFKLHSVPELCGLPAPDWLIQGILALGVMAGLYGPSGHGKSFVALAWALCIATGRDWFGRATSQGPVIYVAAEGGRSIRKRVQAWMNDHGLSAIPDGFF